MRPINDDLMVRIAVNQAVLSSILMCLLKSRAQVSSVYSANFKLDHEFSFIVYIGSWVLYFLENSNDKFWKLNIFKSAL